jgi:hypothetical protein
VSELFDVLTGYFDDQGWNYTVLDGREVAQMRFSGSSGSFAFFADARPDRPVLLCYSVCDDRAPEGQRNAVAELLTRLNYPLVVGDFEMDFADGEVRFRSSIDFEGDSPSTALIRNVVAPNLRTMDAYLPAIKAVMGGDSRPADAAATAGR